ncbi:hypothetical protein QOT17_013649 [Balamuthia mandrillaris]
MESENIRGWKEAAPVDYVGYFRADEGEPWFDFKEFLMEERDHHHHHPPPPHFVEDPHQEQQPVNHHSEDSFGLCPSLDGPMSFVADDGDLSFGEICFHQTPPTEGAASGYHHPRFVLPPRNVGYPHLNVASSAWDPVYRGDTADEFMLCSGATSPSFDAGSTPFHHPHHLLLHHYVDHSSSDDRSPSSSLELHSSNPQNVHHSNPSSAHVVEDSALLSMLSDPKHNPATGEDLALEQSEEANKIVSHRSRQQQPQGPEDGTIYRSLAQGLSPPSTFHVGASPIDDTLGLQLGFGLQFIKPRSYAKRKKGDVKSTPQKGGSSASASKRGGDSKKPARKRKRRNGGTASSK